MSHDGLPSSDPNAESCQGSSRSHLHTRVCTFATAKPPVSFGALPKSPAELLRVGPSPAPGLRVPNNDQRGREAPRILTALMRLLGAVEGGLERTAENSRICNGRSLGQAGIAVGRSLGNLHLALCAGIVIHTEGFPWAGERWLIHHLA